MSLTLIGFIMVVVTFLIVLSKKVHMIIPFILIPVLCAIIAGIPLSDISSYVVSGVASTNNAVILILFSVAYFSLLSETGMFDIIVQKLVTITKNNIYVVMLCTIVVALIGHLDGAYNTTYLITIPTLLPLYKKLRIDSRFLMLLTIMGATAMCIAPWSASIVQLTPFAGVEAMELSKRLLPYGILTFFLAVGVALIAARYTIVKNSKVSLSYGPVSDTTLDTSVKELARPERFWINFLIFVVSIACLFLVKIQVYILFMIFTCITLVINYPGAAEQGKLIKKYSAAMLAPALLFISIGVMVGIMKESGMVDGMIQVILNLIPSSMARYTHIIFGLLLVPLYIVLPYQVMLPIYPILIGIGSSLGIPPAAIMMVFALQYGTACSPLVAATNLGAELAGINVIDHMKFSFFPCWICSIILIAAMVITGIAFI